jgi:hypothetical protein
MTARSNIFRLAILALLLARAPRWVQQIALAMLLGAGIGVVVAIIALMTQR